jgi:dsDNA-specific endonuclease/ATPase MutS2
LSSAGTNKKWPSAPNANRTLSFSTCFRQPEVLKSFTNVLKNDRHTNITPVNEVRLRQLTVDEALPKLDQYLHDAFMGGLIQVRVIHGKGTGTLRQIVREQLAKHPLVKSFRPGDYGEGGEGVTIVELAER